MRHLLREREGGADEARLRGGVVDLPAVSDHAGHRRDVDDAPPTPAHHRHHERARHVEEAVERGPGHALPVFALEGRERRRPWRCRRCSRRRRWARPRPRAGAASASSRLGARRRRRSARSSAVPPASSIAARTAARRLVVRPVVEDDRVACLRQRDGDRGADASAPSGDERSGLHGCGTSLPW